MFDWSLINSLMQRAAIARDTANPEDREDLRKARSRYNSRQTESSLIAWVCSPGWYFDVETVSHEITTTNNHGRVIATSWCGTEGNQISGEIEASPCSCHRPDGRPW